MKILTPLVVALSPLSLLILLSGCTTGDLTNARVETSRQPWLRYEKTMLEENYRAADRLAQQLTNSPSSRWRRMLTINGDDPILVTTIADVNYLDSSSPLGRITAEQIASRLAQLGFNVTEVKLRTKLYVEKAGGEFILSRDVEQIAAEHKAIVVIAGTYAIGKRDNLISLRAVELASKRIIAGTDYTVPNVENLLPKPLLTKPRTQYY